MTLETLALVLPAPLFMFALGACLGYFWRYAHDLDTHMLRRFVNQAVRMNRRELYQVEEYIRAKLRANTPGLREMPSRERLRGVLRDLANEGWLHDAD